MVLKVLTMKTKDLMMMWVLEILTDSRAKGPVNIYGNTGPGNEK